MLGREGPAPFRSQAMPSWTFWTIWAIPQGRRGKWRESPWSEWEPGVGVWSRRADLGEDPLTKDPTRIPSWDPKTQSASDWKLWAEMGWWWSWIGTALWLLPQFLKNWNREINWGVHSRHQPALRTFHFYTSMRLANRHHFAPPVPQPTCRWRCQEGTAREREKWGSRMRWVRSLRWNLLVPRSMPWWGRRQQVVGAFRQRLFQNREIKFYTVIQCFLPF